MPRLGQPQKTKKAPDDKLVASIEAIKKNGFRSTNDFIITYYNSVHGAQSLRIQDGKSYGPVKILDAWCRNVPSNAAEALNLAIINKTSEILLKEAKRATREPSLKLSSSKDKGDLNITYLTSDAGLEDIKESYLSLLPCLCTLLYVLLTAPNDYETWNHTEKVGKFKNAHKVYIHSKSNTIVQLY